jgi:enediyne polyketide synthase
MGLEAMGQVAMAAARRSDPPVFEDVRFDRPVVAPRGQPTTIRIAALLRGSDRVDVVLRSSNADFQIDHFRATCRFNTHMLASRAEAEPNREPSGDCQPLSIDPQAELYGSLLFQEGRFRRLHRYRWLRATGCVAEILHSEKVAWFGPYLPAEMVLGDPATRDAAIHSIQACIPHAVVLPIGIERIVRSVSPIAGPCLARSRERADHGDLLTFDVEITDLEGRIFERWDGLTLRIVERTGPTQEWPEHLLGPYLERRVREVVPGASVAVDVERDCGTKHRARSDRAFQRLLGKSAAIARRPDGKPELLDQNFLLPGNGQVQSAGRCEVSAAHAQNVTLAVAGSGTVACDLEPCTTRSAAVWRDLLGADRWKLAQLIARQAGESDTEAATRIWVAGECLTKVGAGAAAPLVLGAAADSRAVVLHSDQFAIATFVVPDRLRSEPVVLGVLTRRRDAACVSMNTGTS